jgi:aspartyl-tRNA(Asn)/glutamyl-tRNA(Gln) amidotransferase subunit C
MKITRETVQYVAELANLELAEAELEMYRRQLDAILTYVETLNQLDTSGVEPMAQVVTAGAATGRPAWREDEPRNSGVTAEALAAAPDPSAPFFRVPKVIERES